MFRKLTLSFLLTVCAFASSKNSFATTYVWDGSVNTYTLTAADSLYIPSGTFTGTITSFASGARITVSDLAHFWPTNFPNTNGNSARGIMNIYGQFTFSSSLVTNTNFTLNNYGIVTLSAVTMRGNNQTWTNSYGAILNFTGDVLMNGDFGNNNHIINYETVNASGNFQMNNGSRLTNHKDVFVSGDLLLNGGIFNNDGILETTGAFDINSGISEMYNYCKLISSGGIYNSNGKLYNYSYIWSKNDLGNGYIENTSGGQIINASFNHSTPMIHGKDLLVSGGSITGKAFMYFYGFTSTTGTGTTGVAGVTTDTIKMYDITRASPSTIYDDQRGIVHPNVIYNAWGVPDSTRVWFWGCSMEVILEIPLPIKWNYFFVNLVDKIPALTWSAEFDRGTVFNIQRSYDGTNFNTIEFMPSENGRSEYSYNDKLVNTNAPIVYYRIKAREIDGEEKYSPIRVVRFGNTPAVNLQTAPNPFTNNFIINYTAAEKGMITVRLFAVNGQQKLIKNVAVNNGNNIINITEATGLAKGIYVLQISNDNGLISSGKVVKQ